MKFLYRSKNKSGFTLVELMVAICVFAILMLAIAAVLVPSLRMFLGAIQWTSDKNASNTIFRYLDEELKYARDVMYYQGYTDEEVSSDVEKYLSTHASDKGNYYIIKIDNEGPLKGRIYKADLSSGEELIYTLTNPGNRNWKKHDLGYWDFSGYTNVRLEATHTDVPPNGNPSEGEGYGFNRFYTTLTGGGEVDCYFANTNVLSAKVTLDGKTPSYGSSTIFFPDVSGDSHVHFAYEGNPGITIKIYGTKNDGSGGGIVYKAIYPEDYYGARNFNYTISVNSDGTLSLNLLIDHNGSSNRTHQSKNVFKLLNYESSATPESKGGENLYLFFRIPKYDFSTATNTYTESEHLFDTDTNTDTNTEPESFINPTGTPFKTIRLIKSGGGEGPDIFTNWNNEYNGKFIDSAQTYQAGYNNGDDASTKDDPTFESGNYTFTLKVALSDQNATRNMPELYINNTRVGQFTQAEITQAMRNNHSNLPTGYAWEGSYFTYTTSITVEPGAGNKDVKLIFKHDDKDKVGFKELDIYKGGSSGSSGSGNSDTDTTILLHEGSNYVDWSGNNCFCNKKNSLPEAVADGTITIEYTSSSSEPVLKFISSSLGWDDNNAIIPATSAPSGSGTLTKTFTLDSTAANRCKNADLVIQGNDCTIKKCYYTPPQGNSGGTGYTITVSANNDSYGTVSGGGTYSENATVNISASAKTGYRFVKWNDNDTNATRTITVTGNATYTAEFEALPKYTVITSVGGGSGTITATSSNYTHGTKVTIAATPNSNYQVQKWVVDGADVVSTSTTYNFNSITASHKVVVYFEAISTDTPPVEETILGTQSINNTWDYDFEVDLTDYLYATLKISDKTSGNSWLQVGTPDQYDKFCKDNFGAKDIPLDCGGKFKIRIGCNGARTYKVVGIKSSGVTEETILSTQSINNTWDYDFEVDLTGYSYATLKVSDKTSGNNWLQVGTPNNYEQFCRGDFGSKDINLSSYCGGKFKIRIGCNGARTYTVVGIKTAG